MDQPHRLSEDEILKAKQFHLQHFPNQDVPNLGTTETDSTTPTTAEIHASIAVEHDLGFYPDGTRRTLTDEQIALFRHSEIQRLLAERRRQNEARQEKRERAAERGRDKHAQKKSEVPVPARYQNDSMVHAKNDINELSYEEKSEEIKDVGPRKFQWPVLGS